MRWRRWTAVVGILAALVAATGTVVLPAAAQPGDRDPTFTSNGYEITEPVGDPIEGNRDGALQPDGKLLVAVDGADGRMLVARFGTDGYLDEGFGDDGFAAVTFPDTQASSAAVAVDSAGRILLGGAASRQFAVARLTPDGSLDPTFSGDGRVVVAGTGLGRVTDLAVDAQDGVVLGGWVFTGSFEPDGSASAFARLTVDGVADPTFGRDGVTVLDPPRDSAVEAIALTATGGIVGVGFQRSVAGGQDRSMAIRLWPRGRLDRRFGGDGIVALDLGPGHELLEGLHVSGERIVVTGRVGGASRPSRLLVARLGPDGRRARGFGVDGRVLVDVGAGGELGSAVVVDGDGRLLVSASVRTGRIQRGAVFRLLRTGERDLSFAGRGWVDQAISVEPGWGRDVLLTADGRIVLVIGGGGRVGVVRYLAT